MTEPAASFAPASSLVVVTGGSSGIGLQIALAAARDGHPLLLVARGLDALAAAASRCQQAGSPAVHVLTADLSLDAGIDAVVDRVEELDLPVAALVNNAGFGAYGPFAEQDAERLRSVVDVNCLAPVLLTRRLLDRIRDARGGVLFVASLAGYQPGPGMAVYHAAKSFVVLLGVALRDELRASGVRVTTLCPGFVPTGFNAASGVGEVEDRLLARVSSTQAEQVAKAGWRGLKRGRATVMPGTLNKLARLGSRLAPLPFVARSTRGVLGAVDSQGRAID